MKKTYQKATMQVVGVQTEQALLVGSGVEVTRTGYVETNQSWGL